MESVHKDKIYTSPVRKLARFFEQSRDGWKDKYRAAKVALKRVTNRACFLAKRKEHYKQRVKELERALAHAQARERRLEQEVEGLRNQVNEAATAAAAWREVTRTPARQQYGIGLMTLFILLVVTAAISLRGASRAIEVFRACLPVPLDGPAWPTGRLWLLRLGYYKLTRPKVHAEDWIWIVDHTIQLDAIKCFVVLGIRRSALPPAGQCLTHAQVEPLALLPVPHSTGAVVYQQLEDLVAQTGVPRAIVRDHGSDLNAGVAQFCQIHSGTSDIYDIKHKTALVLKHELEADPVWQEFTQLAARTQSQVRQTNLAPLAPPGLRSKARYMNVDILVKWGQDILAYLARPPATRQPLCDPAQVQAKLGWVTRFEQPLREWAAMFQVIARTESLVRQEGLYRGLHLKLAEQLHPLAQTERVQRVQAALLAFVAQEEIKANEGERLLGSREVLESVLGKLKRLEQDQAKSGFTGLLLGLCAMVSTTTQEIIRTALESVPTQQVLAWCAEHLGPSIQAKRREALNSPQKAEQKWDELLEPV